MSGNRASTFDTWLYVGGPLDGRRQAHVSGSREVHVPVLPAFEMATDRNAEPPQTRPFSVFRYESRRFFVDGQEFRFWCDPALTDTDVTRMLIENYRPKGGG